MDLSPQPESDEAQIIYRDRVLTLLRQSLHLPNKTQVMRTVVELPTRVLILPIKQDQTVLSIREYNTGAACWQNTLPGGKVEIEENPAVRAQLELRQETGYRAGSLTQLLSWYAHPGIVRQTVHAFIARDLIWDPLPGDAHELIQVYCAPLQEQLSTTRIDYRWDPEAAFALWLYAALEHDHAGS